MPTVKGARRRYDSSGRRAQAHRSREAVLDAAQSLFLEAGYGVTTVAAVAARAGVSAETVYKAFGGKSGLVRALYERGLRGQGPVAAYERSDALRERESDPRVVLRGWSELTTEVATQVTPIRLLIRAAAATDPEIAALLTQGDQERLERMRHHARFLADRGHLRAGLTMEKAADVLYTCSSVEIYELLVLQRGWSPPEFAGFIAEFMIGTLLDPGA